MPFPRDTSKWTVMIDNKLTFCGALHKYFDVNADEHNLKQDTINDYAGEYERHILPRLQNRPLEESPSLRHRSALIGLPCSIFSWEHHWKGSLSAK